MLKKTLILGVLLISLFATGCAKVISQEVFEDYVIIEDSYYGSSWVQPVSFDKFNTTITHPAQYKIYVRYGEYKLTIDNKNTYELYKDKKGETVKATFVKEKYDDGTEQIRFIGIVN